MDCPNPTPAHCSNAEFLDFVRDGGYRSKQWWSEEGWRWRTFRNAKWPTFWVPEGPQGECPGAGFVTHGSNAGCAAQRGSTASCRRCPSNLVSSVLPPPSGLHRYKLRLVFEVVDLPPALPAVVNHHEARAYANWLSAKQVGWV